MSKSTHVFSEPPLVWVRHGRTEHPAFLLETGTKRSLIQWISTKELEDVENGMIDEKLTPRKRRRTQSTFTVPPVNHHNEITQKMSLGPNVDVSTDDDDDYDDEIEVVLTISPPSPNRIRGIASQIPDNGCIADQGVIDDLATPTAVPAKGYPKTPVVAYKQSSLGGAHTVTEEKPTSTSATETELTQVPEKRFTNTSSQPIYTFRSSAYVQNLAEICFTITRDARWRVGGENKEPLFAWEKGDDLTAIETLSRLYTPWQHKPGNCVCLICRDLKSPPPSSEQPPESPAKGKAEEDSNSRDSDFERAIHLYCRMYYRKGPWFRLDDLFTRYYLRKRDRENDSEEQAERKEHHQVVKQGGNESNKELVNEAKLQQNIEAMSDLLNDVRRLFDLGLIRTFASEAQCGQLVGEAKAVGGCALLNGDERKSILRKLGGARGKAKTKMKQMPGQNRQEDNEIWKQMCQQKSIAMFGKSKQNAYLPVMHHVTGEIVNKLATNLVLHASCVEYLPASVLRQNVGLVKKALKCLAGQSWNRTIVAAFRLREAPVRALRRCCRLYLCATSGPGDMRGDGTNGWKSLRERDVKSNEIPLNRLVPPPLSTWHNVVYPGLSCRFGMISCAFRGAYTPLPHHDTNMERFQVFLSKDAFTLWELSVEVRANVDYLVELCDMIQYKNRRKERQDMDGDGGQPQDGDEVDSCDAVDFLDLLTVNGRKSLICEMCSFGTLSQRSSITEKVIVTVENVLSRLDTMTLGAIDDWEGEDKDGKHSQSSRKVLPQNDCERILVAFAVIVVSILQRRHDTISNADKEKMMGRPWLRHLYWEGVLSYALWDCIPIMEKRGLYGLAAKALEVLVFGTTQSSDWRKNSVIPKEVRWGSALFRKGCQTPFCEALVSRRAVGKAFERLVIDYGHMLRQELATQAANAAASLGKKRKVHSSSSHRGDQPANDRVNQLITTSLPKLAETGFIPFSAIRCLARRLKRPLKDSLRGVSSLEAQRLNIRLDNDDENEGASTSEKKATYKDWSPTTDTTVAMSINGVENVGGRCSYVGYEDNESNGKINPSSLNVEQLAMEFYSSGRLPLDSPLGGGGWTGWHDEGGHLRALFRILCGQPILGMHDGCGTKVTHRQEAHMCTIFLTPYQGAPNDLHVGSATLGFYARRKERIECYLERLADLGGQEICHLIHEAIEERLKSSTTYNPDIMLHRDIGQARTLAMLAAGFGGRALSHAFRCMLFDYRHFSGGLPDLLLTRAKVSSNKQQPSLIDLGDWVGEAFSKQAKNEAENEAGSSLLIDRDDEFLGCNKMGDSASRSSNRWGRQPSQRGRRLRQASTEKLVTMPKRLDLTHNDSSIEVECMFVEVKSVNDRLDGRQEDWLNVLDSVGNARVCKFVNKAKPKNSRKASKK